MEKEWHRQQQYLEAHLTTTAKQSGLCMTSLSSHRKLLEEREKLDIVLSDPAVMPADEQGKGYRVRSEWWAQGEVRRKSQLRTTLPRRHQPGAPPAQDGFEYIGRPALIAQPRTSLDARAWETRSRLYSSETTGADAVIESERPFTRSQYFKARSTNIAHALLEHFPHTPDVSALAVVGTAIAESDHGNNGAPRAVDIGRGCGVAGVDVLINDGAEVRLWWYALLYVGDGFCVRYTWLKCFSRCYVNILRSPPPVPCQYLSALFSVEHRIILCFHEILCIVTVVS